MSIELAEQYEEQELYDKAYDEYKKLLEARPKSIDLLQKTAHIASILNKTEEAEKYFMQMIELDKTNVVPYEQLMDMFINSDKFKYYTCRGNLHVVQNQLSHAAGDFKKALEKVTDERKANEVRFVLANIYNQLGKENQAIDEYLRLLDSHNAPEEAYLNLSKIYEEQGVLSSASEILERAISDGIETNKIKETLAEIYLKNNETSKASNISSDQLVQLRCMIEEEKFKEALNKIEELQPKYKKDSKFLSLVAQYYYATKDFDKSLEYVEEFSKFAKNSPLIYQMRALIYEEKNDAYKEHFNWAKYNLLRGNNDVALNEYMIALQNKQDDSALILTIAELLEEMKDNTHAIEFYERLLKYEPNNKKALEKLGEFRINIGDYKMAIEYLEKLYCLDNRAYKNLKNLAVAYEKAKNPIKAVEFYNKYLSSSSIPQEDIAPIKKKVEKLEGKAKTYSEAEGEDDGLIGKIMRFFNK